MSKTSNISLYSADKLEEKALHVVSLDAKLSFTSPNTCEMNCPKFSLKGQANPAHDVDDVGLYMKTLSDTVNSDSVAQGALIAANTSNISTLDAREAANHAAQASLLGAETARATTAETVNASAISAEEVRALAAESANADAIVSESNRAVAAEAALEAKIDVEKVRIDGILAGADISLDTFLEVANAFQSADTSILVTIASQDARLSALEAQVALLTA